jgi:hypothetical protein
MATAGGRTRPADPPTGPRRRPAGARPQVTLRDFALSVKEWPAKSVPWRSTGRSATSNWKLPDD